MAGRVDESQELGVVRIVMTRNVSQSLETFILQRCCISVSPAKPGEGILFAFEYSTCAFRTSIFRATAQCRHGEARGGLYCHGRGLAHWLEIAQDNKEYSGNQAAEPNYRV